MKKNFSPCLFSNFKTILKFYIKDILIYREGICLKKIYALRDDLLKKNAKKI